MVTILTILVFAFVGGLFFWWVFIDDATDVNSKVDGFDNTYYVDEDDSNSHRDYGDETD